MKLMNHLILADENYGKKNKIKNIKGQANKISLFSSGKTTKSYSNQGNIQDNLQA